MKIELKRDDASLKDITVELKPGYYQDQSQWGSAVGVTVLHLVEFYEEWIDVAIHVKAFASLKQSAKNLLKEIEELGTYLGGIDDDQV